MINIVRLSPAKRTEMARWACEMNLEFSIDILYQGCKKFHDSNGYLDLWLIPDDNNFLMFTLRWS